MGIEYEVHPAEPDEFPSRSELESTLKLLPYFDEVTEHGFQFRGESRTDGWPDATVVIESDHIYLCNHLGNDHVFYQILGRLIAHLVGDLPHEKISVRQL